MARNRETALGAATPQERHARMEAAIAAASETLLRTRGWTTGATRALAELAGVSQGTLYRYYPTREALAAHVVVRRLRSLQAEVVGRIEAETGEVWEIVDRLVADGIAALRGDLTMYRGFHQMFREVMAVEIVQDAERVAHRAVVTAVNDLLARDAEQLAGRSVPRVAFLLVSTLESVVMRTLATEPERLLDAAFEKELRGMCTDLVSPAREPPQARSSQAPERGPDGRALVEV